MNWQEVYSKDGISINEATFIRELSAFYSDRMRIGEFVRTSEGGIRYFSIDRLGKGKLTYTNNHVSVYLKLIETDSGIKPSIKGFQKTVEFKIANASLKLKNVVGELESKLE